MTLAQLARDLSDNAVNLLEEVMNDANQDTKVRIDAAKYIIERGFGKAIQQLEVADDGRASGCFAVARATTSHRVQDFRPQRLHRPGASGDVTRPGGPCRAGLP